MDVLAKAVEAAYPDDTVAAVTPQTARPDNAVARVTLEDGSVSYIKTAADTDRRLRRERGAIEIAGDCPIRVPDIRAVNLDATPPYLVLGPLPGTPLNDPWTGDGDRASLLRRAGEIIARIHTAGFDTAARIQGWNDGTPRLATASWVDTLCTTIEWRVEDWFPDRFTELPPILIDLLRTAEPRLADTDPRLLHADCSRINLHLEPSGALDWERAIIGDPAFDLVDAAGHLIDQVDVDEADRPAYRNALHEGYRSRAGRLPPHLERRRPLYRAVAHLLVLQTFDEWAPSVDEPTDDLAEQVRSEFRTRLATAREALEP